MPGYLLNYLYMMVGRYPRLVHLCKQFWRYVQTEYESRRGSSLSAYSNPVSTQHTSGNQ